jgi:hypothetical protein
MTWRCRSSRRRKIAGGRFVFTGEVKEITMRASRKSVVRIAGAGALALMMSASLFAAPQRGYDQRNGRSESRSSHRNEDRVRGVVERINLRSGVVLLRDVATRRTFEVNMRDTRRSSGIDLRDLRRGDIVTLTGDWTRNGFAAERIVSVDSRRGRR